MNTTPFGLGAVITEQKLTDFDLGSLTPSTSPNTFMPVYALEIENQGKQPACGSHSGAEMIDIFKTIERGIVQRVSPAYIWKKIKSFDGYPISAGTDITSVLKAITQIGGCDFALLPNNTDLSLEDYAKDTTTPEMDLSAVNNRIGPVYAFTYHPTMQQLKDAIYAHKAVIVLAQIGDEFWSPSYAEKDILPLRVGRPVVSGHFFTAYAYDEQYIYFYNHWSDKWGRAGIGYFAENYLPKIVMIGTTVNLVGKFMFTDVLKYGSTGTAVGILQTILKKEGYFTGKTTTFFGGETAKALQKWQVAHGFMDFAKVTDYSNKTPIQLGPRTKNAMNQTYFVK